MKINKKLIPIKIHYFCFLGCVAPIFPFLIVVGIQLGIPVSVTGTLSATSLICVVFAKPILAALADAFPSYRRLIFLTTLSIMTAALSSLYFMPPMREDFRLQGQLVRAGKDGALGDVDGGLVTTGNQYLGATAAETMILAHDDGSCYVAVAWDCVVCCSDSWTCLNANNTTPTAKSIQVTTLDSDHKFEVLTGEDRGGFLAPGGSEHSGLPLWGVERPSNTPTTTNSNIKGRLYRIKGINVSLDIIMANVSFDCRGGRWEGSSCLGVWHYWQFWGFAGLLLVGQIMFNTAVSVTDAIIVDTIGRDGDYGLQRAWGTVGWGLMGPVSGALIDFWSGTSITKDYAPAFFLCFILGGFDTLFSAITIKVPKLEAEIDLLQKVWPLLRQPRFFVFCVFALINGAFDGLAASWIFVMQEDMAVGTGYVDYLKLIQGLTLFVQCGIEAPVMFVNKWFMTKMGAHYVTSLVFFLYIFRLLGLSVAGAYWPVWTTLVVEVLNGPCYGLGYTAIVVYSSRISPPGTSTTVQSLTNMCYESFGYAVAMFGGGLLYSKLGGPGMYLVSGVTAIITFILHIISLILLPPPPEESTKLKSPSLNEEEEETEAIKLEVEGEEITDAEEGSLTAGEKEADNGEKRV